MQAKDECVENHSLFKVNVICGNRIDFTFLFFRVSVAAGRAVRNLGPRTQSRAKPTGTMLLKDRNTACTVSSNSRTANEARIFHCQRGKRVVVRGSYN